MKQSENHPIVDKMHSIIIEIMVDIDAYCKKQGIMYYLSGGSCLGAIRHKGFIPWDHDGDIMMPRREYEKFLVGFAKAYKRKYCVGSLQTDKDWVRPYAKIWKKGTYLKETKTNEKPRGIGLDVFPIDGMTSSAKKQKKFFRKMRFMSEFRKDAVRTGFYDHENLRLIRRILHILLKPFGGRYFAIRIEKNAKQYDFYNEELVACSVPCHYGKKEIIKQEHMASAIDVPFENLSLPVPVGYDVYLKNLYGDYMKVPQHVIDVENRILKAYDLKCE